MSGRPEVTSTAAEPVSSRSRRGNSWAEVAAVFGFFGVIFFLSWGYWCKLPRGEVIAFGLTGGPLILLSLLVALLNSLPCTRYPGDYPTLVPFRHGSRWLVHPPGVTFWAVFPSSLCVLYYLGLGIVAATLDWGLRWALGGVIAMAILVLVAAVTLGRSLRTRPELEVNEERREVHWRPNAAWAWPVTLPFETIIGIRVVDTGRWDKLICYPEIAWRSCTGRVRKTRLPISEDLKGVQEVVARLQVAVFGTTSPVTDGPRQTL